MRNQISFFRSRYLKSHTLQLQRKIALVFGCLGLGVCIYFRNGAKVFLSFIYGI